MKPMLSATVENAEYLSYPMIASPKLDGIRALVLPGLGLVSRSLKPIRNKYAQAQFNNPELVGLDGELILGQHDSTVFRRTDSAVMSFSGDHPTLRFHVFDTFQLSLGFQNRLHYLQSEASRWPTNVLLVPQLVVNSVAELLVFENDCLAQGYEGVMLRGLHGPYKQGRSTLREGYLMKLKRFADAEAVVLRYEERMHNGNTATTNALGHTERSSHKENMVGRGDLGALVVKGVNGPYAGQEFSIGTGFDDAERASIWKADYVGKTCKYKYFPQGSKDAPRFPVFLGWVHDR
jgi:DNA ligase-1